MIKPAGFTLIEMVVAIILVGILAAASLQGIVLGTKNYIIATRDYLELFREGKTALERMVREIRQCSPEGITFLAEGVQIVKMYATPEAVDEATTVSFEREGTQVIRRSEEAIESILVEHVDAFQAINDANNVVTLSLTLKRGDNEVKLQTSVFPRFQ